MGSTKPKRSETPPWIGETGETNSPISHQHKNTPTILAREPILVPDVDIGGTEAEDI